MPNRQESDFIFQAKEKGLLSNGPSRKGPYISKYKWTRQSAPANNAQNTKKVIATAAQKRKQPQVQCTRPGKKTANKGKEKEKAEISFNSEGFYEVRVDYEHVSKLAVGCGFKEKEIEDVIQADNAQRQANVQPQASGSEKETEVEDQDLSRFELDSTDELTSDEEAC